MADAPLDMMINRIANRVDNLESRLDDLQSAIEGDVPTSDTHAQPVGRGGTLGKLDRVEETLKRSMRLTERLLEGLTGEAGDEEADHGSEVRAG